MKQPVSDQIVISRSVCQLRSALVVLFVAGNVYCLNMLYSEVFVENRVCSPTKQVVAPGPVTGPYSTAIEANGFLFISGQIAVVDGVVVGSVEEQADRALKNIQSILVNAGIDMNNVVKCTVFMTDISNYAAINKVYASYFDLSAPDIDGLPARAAFAVKDLPLGALVEIEAIAIA